MMNTFGKFLHGESRDYGGPLEQLVPVCGEFPPKGKNDDFN
jgi:hypothetical protein